MADSDDFESADEDSIQIVEKPDDVGASVPDTEVEPSPPDTEASQVKTPIKVISEQPNDEIQPLPVEAPEREKTPEVWGWGNWSSWAQTSMSSVADLANKTSQGLAGAMETFEASLGLPTPEELAKEIKEAQIDNDNPEVVKETSETKSDADNVSKPTENEKQEISYMPGAGLWSGLTALSNTGTQLLATGLEKLEQVSTQAYEALNEMPFDEGGDRTGKKKVRDSSKGASLMAVLQEAKSRYDVQEKISEETKRTMAYLFDEKQGLSQLEALDMLSRECVHKMKSSEADGFVNLFVYIETSLELKSGDSEIIIEQLGAAITDCLKTIKVELPITKLNQCRFDVAQLLSNMDMTSMDETSKPSDVKKVATLDNALHAIASFAARSVELFKKIAELNLLKSTLEVDIKTQADTIKFLNEVLCCELDNIREQFEAKLAQVEISKAELDQLYLETSNAVSYVQETLHYFVPILKWIVVKTHK